MKTEHTPTPWEIGISHTEEIAIRHPEGDCIATVCDLLEGEAQANASFIVRACNSHDELVACLEDILDADGDLNVMDFNRYRAALKKASAK